jgi:hypothetical protein
VIVCVCVQCVIVVVFTVCDSGCVYSV